MTYVYEIIKDMEHEYAIELELAMRTKALMRKTLNPIRRYKYYAAYRMFMAHASGIRHTIYIIKKKHGL